MADDKGFLKAEIANDGLHPNAKGYELIKPLAAAAITTVSRLSKNNDVQAFSLKGPSFQPRPGQIWIVR
jgi:hypothetical protein